MKKIYCFLIVFVLIFTLSSCTNSSGDSETLKKNVLSEIDFYLEYNDLLEATFDVGLPDVEEKILYTKEDFFNYDIKDTKNVDINYDDYYNSFVNLIFVKRAIEKIENFKYKQYFTNTVDNESVYVNLKTDELYIEYFEYIEDIEMIMRHSYTLRKVNDEAHMIKNMEIYDNDEEEKLLLKKIEVYNDVVVRQEYYLGTGSFVYEYTSYQDQEYFMYKGTMGTSMQFLRQTIEYYIAPYSSYVSFDIKEDELEDYRVKVFKDGHRVMKVDVNVKNSNPTVNELTWNLLSINGWTTVQYILEDYSVYRGSFSTMTDYELSVQLNGYGKVTAYKMFEGDITDEDITLVDYDLSSGYTLSDVLAAKNHFESNYITKLVSYGFSSNDPNNRHVVYDNVIDLILPFENYIDSIE